MTLLSDDLIEQVLARAPRLTIGVFGDLFLDRYLELDATLTEPSLETGLDAYQVTRVRSVPGAAGTIINNLAALGVGRICPVALIGDDGEGYELRQGLAALGVVDASRVRSDAQRRTPTYTKPMLAAPGQLPRELNRFDIKNRAPLEAATESELLADLASLWPQLDALLVLDQVSEANCGVVTTWVREALPTIVARRPEVFVLADSRERIALFRGMSLKPNRRECERATTTATSYGWIEVARALARQTERPLYCTLAEQGILVIDPRRSEEISVPAYPVHGPIDIVGAGDSTSAGIAIASAAGLNSAQSAAFGALVASITVQQLGTTGSASPAQVRARWAEIERK